MKITKVNIENFKGFEGTFSLELNEGVNIIVGDNEAGKTTILEAIHLCLSGYINGRYIKNELTQYLFNFKVVQEYLDSVENNRPAIPPHILIEVMIEGNDLAFFEGDGNSETKRACCVSLKIEFNDLYQGEYQEHIKNGKIKTLPIEYYHVVWTSCARQNITARSIPIKSALIDSSAYRFQNGSDVYISRIIKENLETNEIVDISQAYRKMKEIFMDEEAIININNRIEKAAKISDKEVKLSVDLSPKNAWENSLMTYLDEIPFHHVGKGEQCIVKTKLALGHKKTKEANLLLIEEPENHLSHTKLNELIKSVQEDNDEKQIIISTHSSFVANKLGLANLILLRNKQVTRLNELPTDTINFFQKLAGYDTLRLILCEKAILVEGDSDELVVQRAYMDQKEGALPIQKGVDVISVGTSFLRFLQIADNLSLKVAVVTDNDGNVEALNRKYADYLGANQKDNIKISFDPNVDDGVLNQDGNDFNYNTLEPKIVVINGLETMNRILGKEFGTIDDLLIHMHSKKTESALKIFESEEPITYPNYILDAIAE